MLVKQVANILQKFCVFRSFNSFKFCKAFLCTQILLHL